MSELDRNALEAALVKATKSYAVVSDNHGGWADQFAAAIQVAIRAYLEAAPSPSPAPVVVALRAILVEADHMSMTMRRRKIFGAGHSALASLSQPAKDERGGFDAYSNGEERALRNDVGTTPANPAQVTDAMVEAMQRIRTTAMRQSVVARVPECGEFGAIAQDADWLLDALSQPHPADDFQERLDRVHAELPTPTISGDDIIAMRDEQAAGQLFDERVVDALRERFENQVEVAFSYASDEKLSHEKLIPSVFEIQIGHLRDIGRDILAALAQEGRS